MANSTTHKLQTGVLALCLLVLLVWSTFLLTALNPLLIRAYVDKHSDLPERQEIVTDVLAFFKYTSPLDHFTPDEQQHMRDVRTLLTLMTTITLLALLCGTVLLARRHTGTAKRQTAQKNSVLLCSAGRWVGIVLVLVVVSSLLIDFSSLFSAFHALLFPQGNYLFPAESLLIRTFPEAVFRELGTVFGTALLCAGVLCIILSSIYCRILHKRNA